MNQPLAFQSASMQKPGMVTAIGILTLINGILNILWGIGLAISLLLTIVGIFCVPLAIYPIVLGILEILYAVKLLPNPPQPVKPAKYLAIMEIVDILLGDVISLIVGILALVFYNDPTVQAYFAGLNSQGAAVTPYAPSPTTQ